MKTSLSLGLTFAALCALPACSSDEGTERGAGGTGMVPVAGSGGASAGAGGAAAGGAGGAGGAAAGVGTLGQPLTITAEGNVTDTANDTDISGGAAYSESATMVVPAALTYREGGLCFKGTTATVPNDMSYGTHWGAEMSLDLLRVPNPDAPTVDAGADAGADAGEVLGLIPADWPRGNVIGFAYTLVGNDMAAADKGVPPAQVRFKALPAGANPANDNYCSSRTPVDGVEERVLFSDITFECWTPGNYTLAEDPIQYVQTPDPNKVVGTRPNPNALRNISWQIASDLNIDPIAFDFCVTNLRPILAN